MVYISKTPMQGCFAGSAGSAAPTAMLVMLAKHHKKPSLALRPCPKAKLDILMQKRGTPDGQLVALPAGRWQAGRTQWSSQPRDQVQGQLTFSIGCTHMVPCWHVHEYVARHSRGRTQGLK